MTTDAPGQPQTSDAKASQSLPAVMRSIVFLLVIWMLNAQMVPGINESHYLPKAKHLWDPSYAPGDLFLSSSNAHWLFAELAGWMSTWLPLEGVAWVGRVVSWTFMAIAWTRLSSRLQFSTLVAAAALAGWILAVKLGNWAGEWAIGGFESKSLAYPCLVMALAEAVDRKWPRVWVWSGLAVALHPLVGGWAGLTLAMTWFAFGLRESAWKSNIIAIIIGGVISLVGLLPALATIGGPARSGNIVVAQIHAFYRLAHHQSPHLFSVSQHISGGTTLSLLIVAIVVLKYLATRRSAQNHDTRMQAAQRLIQVALFSLLVSGIGLFIDLVIVRMRPDIAAGLLRFYWFRWSDVMVPLAWVSVFWVIGLELSSWASREKSASTADSTPNSETASKSVSKRSSAYRHYGALWLTMCGLGTFGFVVDQVSKQLATDVAPADQTLLMSDSTQLASGPEVVDEWIAACRWIRENTPSDALFLTPRAQQTFKWYAQRAEVVTYKDMPQDGESLLKWYERVGRCAPPRGPNLEPLGWTTDQLLALHRLYGFRYLLVDRRIQKAPPPFHLVYPVGEMVTTTYAIFEMPSR